MNKKIIMLSANCNRTNTLLCLGTKKGYEIYNAETMNIISKNENIGEIYLIDILEESNIIALVGNNNENDYFNRSKITIWDHCRNDVVNVIDNFNNKIKRLRFCKDYLICSTSYSIHFFKIENNTFKLIKNFDTCENKNGTFSFCYKKQIVCFPGSRIGTISIFNIKRKTLTTDFEAHDNEISQIFITDNGEFLITASCKGTIIRSFLIKSKSIVIYKEFRRGSSIANIYSICYSPSLQCLAVTSDQETIHFFTMKKKEITYYDYYINFIPKVISYERSIYTFKIKNYKNLLFTNKQEDIICFCLDGSYYKFSIQNDFQLLQCGNVFLN